MPQAPKDRLLTALAGGLPAVQPVAPLYLGLYLAGPRHAARARLWRERAEAAGGLLAVTYEDYLSVELQVWWEGYRLFAELPDWLGVPAVSPRSAIEGWAVEVDEEGCFWRGPADQRIRLDQPFTDAAPPLWEAADPPRTVADVAARMPLTTREAVAESGTYALAEQLVAGVGDEYALHWCASAPYPAAYAFLGFSGLMIAMRERPELIIAIVERRLANTIAGAAAARHAGVEVAFIEEWACSSDLISPADYLTFAWPFERELCAELKRLGFRSVFYFCGAIDERLERLTELEADALAFEESKKGWTIDLDQVRRELGDERCLFGNLDVVKVRDLPRAALTGEVHAMIDRCGPAAFATSIGSPLTLDTPPARVDALIRAARGYA